MRPIADAKADRAAEVAPAVRHVVPWRVVSVKVLPERCLSVAFVDGAAGEVDMRGFLADPRTEATVFEPLRDLEVFAQVEVVMGAVQWPNGADLAPDAMYDAIRQNGCWAPGISAQNK